MRKGRHSMRKGMRSMRKGYHSMRKELHPTRKRVGIRHLRYHHRQQMTAMEISVSSIVNAMYQRYSVVKCNDDTYKCLGRILHRNEFTHQDRRHP
jgi:hypothetical protein